MGFPHKDEHILDSLLLVKYYSFHSFYLLSLFVSNCWLWHYKAILPWLPPFFPLLSPCSIAVYLLFDFLFVRHTNFIASHEGSWTMLILSASNGMVTLMKITLYDNSFPVQSYHGTSIYFYPIFCVCVCVCVPSLISRRRFKCFRWVLCSTFVKMMKNLFYCYQQILVADGNVKASVRSIFRLTYLWVALMMITWLCTFFSFFLFSGRCEPN